LGRNLSACVIALAVSAAAAWLPVARAQSPALKQAPAATSAAEVKKAKKVHGQAREAERAGDWRAAFELHSEAAALAPANAGYVLEREAARFRLVQQHVERAEREALAGPMEQARDALREALRLDPSYSVAQERLVQFSPQPWPARESQSLPDEGLIQLEPQPGKRTINFRGTTLAAFEELGRQFGITASVEDDVRRRSVQFNLQDM